MSASGEIRCLVQNPSLKDLKETNKRFNLECTDSELEEYELYLKDTIANFNFVDNLNLESYISKHGGKREYWFPNESENKLNAWYVKCEIKGTETGKIAGKRVAIKDNTAVAGIPMMNGSTILEGYIPEYDATVVQRILNEGGIISGKATCESLCLSGASFLTAKGPVPNPVNSKYMSGGSSSGSAVTIALGEVDLATGADQGGSIRIPASYCGIVGLKPTYGLIPYTGAASIIPCIDHLGPMTKNVADCALFLEVLAGYDNGYDCRQTAPFEVPEYSKLIYPNIIPSKKLKVGVLQEGVELSDQNVQTVFNKAVTLLQKCEFLDVGHVSLPSHKLSGKSFFVLIISGTYGTVIDGCGIGSSLSGFQSHSLAKKLFDKLKTNAKDLTETLKLYILAGDYIHQNHGTYHYAKAASSITFYREEYNKLLQQFDVIIMPTVPNTPAKIPSEDASIKEKIDTALGMVANTAIFDGTGHPALSLNCGYDKEFPVGLMVVGKHFDEVGVFNAGSIFEYVFNKCN